MSALEPLLALSRSRHSVIDVAMPGFAALLWLGRLPPWPVLIVAIVVALAGYTALYALNDLVGVVTDKEKFAGAGPNPGYAVEASPLRHPVAQGRLSMRRGVAWFAAWYLVALVGAAWLNPWLIVVVLAAPVLEIAYCRLLRVSAWRVLLSGLVKALGPIAAVLTVVPRPALGGMALMVAWLMAWEIGGQNIPADWNDVEEDRRVGARTIPLVFGPAVAGWAVLALLALTVLLSLALPVLSPLPLGWGYTAAVLVAGSALLLVPAVRLVRDRTGRRAARLFDLTSLYPVAMLAIITGSVLAA